MKKQHNTPSITPYAWEDSDLLHRLATYGKQIGTGLLLLLALAVLAYRFFAGSQSVSVRDYVDADNAFQQLMQAPTSDRSDALASLNALLLKHQELHEKYDGLLAQLFLNRGEGSSALQYGQLALNRTEEENKPFYIDYAQTTLLIGSNQYADALKRALALQQKMNESRQQGSPLFGETLYAFNLLRIGSLQQQLGLTAEENETWNSWKRLMEENRDPNLMQAIAAFNVGNITLIDYIDARQKIITKIK